MKKLLTVFAIALVLTLAIAATALALDVPDTTKPVAWGELDSITTILGHEVDNTSYVVRKMPTCTETGLADFKCLKEGAGIVHTVVVKALGHDWASAHDAETLLAWGHIKKAPTCTEFGEAEDVCLRCKITGKTRVIDMRMHKYDATTYAESEAKKLANGDLWLGYFTEKGTDAGKHFEVITMPTCAREGDAYRKCIKCGHVDRTYKVSLRTVAHTLTDWKVVKEPTCWSEGQARRACVVCGLVQYLTSPGVDKENYYKKVAIRNPGWDNTWEGTVKPNPNRDEFPKAGGYWEEKDEEHWLNTCYSHTDVFVCPYCKCDPKVWKAAGVEQKHFRIARTNMKLHSHLWKDKPEEKDDAGVEAYAPSATGKWLKDTDKKREEYAWWAAKSISATCLYEGIDLYKCVYDDGVADAKWEQKHSGPQLDPYRYKMLRTPALGHNWKQWELADTYTLKGKEVYHFVRYCARCMQTENKITYDAEGENLVEEKEVKVTSVTLNKKSVSLKVGKTFQIVASTSPVDAKKVTYKSADKKIAKVSSSGLVTAKSKGTVKITVTADGVTATLKVKVK